MKLTTKFFNRDSKGRFETDWVKLAYKILCVSGLALAAICFLLLAMCMSGCAGTPHLVSHTNMEKARGASALMGEEAKEAVKRQVEHEAANNQEAAAEVEHFINVYEVTQAGLQPALDTPSIGQQVKPYVQAGTSFLPSPWKELVAAAIGLAGLAGGAIGGKKGYDHLIGIPKEIWRAEERVELDPSHGGVGSISYDDPATKARFKAELSDAAFKRLYPNG